MRQVFANVCQIYDKYGYSVNFTKWTAFLRQHQFYVANVTDVIFYKVVKRKTPAEMNFDEFIEAMKLVSRSWAS